MNEKQVILRKKREDGTYTTGRFSLASVKACIAKGWELMPTKEPVNPAKKEIQKIKELNKTVAHLPAVQEEIVAAACCNNDEVFIKGAHRCCKESKITLPADIEQMKLKEIVAFGIESGLLEQGKYYRSKTEAIAEIKIKMEV